MTTCRLARDAFDYIRDPKGEGSRTFIRLFEKEAIAAAAASDLRRQAGCPLGPLDGILISIKDLFDVAGVTTLSGSRLMRKRPAADSDATVVARLRSAGAVIVGTTNMTEFAMGALGTNAHYGTPLNPYDRKTGRVPGGSSSGAAVSVADGMVTAAIGSDTAGSVQVPAAFCGIVGFKPTARRVPLKGALPLAPSVDSIGPLGRSVECCAAIDAVIAQDGASFESPPPEWIRIGVPTTVVQDDLDETVAAAFSRALDALSRAGVQLVDLPCAEFAEIARSMANFGFSVAEGYAFHRKYLEDSRDAYDPLVAARFERGAGILAADYIDLVNTRASLIRRFARADRAFDALIMPTVQMVAPPLSPLLADERLWLSNSLRAIRNPGLSNFLDRCAISIPCHAAGEAPVGLSLMGRHMEDHRLLSVGATVQSIVRRALGEPAGDQRFVSP
ncbi:Glutamyl-tRNA(Gln) amidotransferase subunit A [Pigmentiphaga humi]|uniref:Glutamyl-tRNA(Gln) amidotransferase subunit A n=2 Tax=Pigmentiphaga humi TaxID=2478468 RepID=A0A3P4B7Y2_9BURK|nr:Glutamyl-tRNA(Gln) amidotransferase subunit A [Pigmentiphaga humi]